MAPELLSRAMLEYLARGAVRKRIGRSSFLFLLLSIPAALWGGGDPAQISDPRKVRIAFEPALERLVHRWESASGIPIEATPQDSIHALRLAAAHRTDFALILGEVSPGQRSLLAVRSGSRPEVRGVGWEAGRFLGRSDCEMESVRWTEVLDRLRGVAESGFADPRGWRSIRSAEELRSRFLPPHERPDEGMEDFAQTQLEAFAVHEVLEGSATLVFAFSLRTSHPELREIPIEAGGEAAPFSAERVRTGDFPTAVEILLVSSRELEAESLAFSEFVLGATGQTEMERAGFLPLDPAVQAKSLLRLRSPGRITPIHR